MNIIKLLVMANAFPYQFTSTPAVLDHPAVYKLNFGKKYFIWKGKTLKGSIEQNCIDIQKLRFNPKPGHIFMPIVEAINKGRVMFCKVEVLIITDDLQQLLDKEKNELENCKRDLFCLNTVLEQHIPKWIAEQLATGKSEPKKDTRQNKAITATFPANEVVVRPTSKKLNQGSNSADGKVNNLLAAFEKLNGK